MRDKCNFIIPVCERWEIITQLPISYPGKGATPYPTLQCCSYWKGSLLVALDYSRQLYFFTYLSYSKSIIGFLLQFLEETKNIIRPMSWFPKSCDPGHSSNTFCLDSLWPYTSHPLFKILPEVTGRFPKIQQQNHHSPKLIPQKGIINCNACSNNRNIPRQNIYQQMIFFLINYYFQRFHFPEKIKKSHEMSRGKKKKEMSP